VQELAGTRSLERACANQLNGPSTLERSGRATDPALRKAAGSSTAWKGVDSSPLLLDRTPRPGNCANWAGCRQASPCALESRGGPRPHQLQGPLLPAASRSLVGWLAHPGGGRADRPGGRGILQAWAAASASPGMIQALGFRPGFRRGLLAERRRAGVTMAFPFPSWLPGFARWPLSCLLSPASGLAVMGPGSSNGLLLLLLPMLADCAAGGRRPHSRPTVRRQTSTPSMRPTGSLCCRPAARPGAGAGLDHAPPLVVYYLDDSGTGQAVSRCSNELQAALGAQSVELIPHHRLRFRNRQETGRHRFPTHYWKGETSPGGWVLDPPVMWYSMTAGFRFDIEPPFNTALCARATRPRIRWPALGLAPPASFNELNSESGSAG